MTPLPIQRVCHRIGDAASKRTSTDAAGTAPEAGFTLIEVLVSFVLFAIVSGGAVVAVVNALKASHTSQQRVDAAAIAQKYTGFGGDMSTVRSGALAPFTDSVKSEDFTVKRSIAFVGTATTCAPGASFTISVEVFQKQTLAQRTSTVALARTDSVIACG